MTKAIRIGDDGTVTRLPAHLTADIAARAEFTKQTAVLVLNRDTTGMPSQFLLVGIIHDWALTEPGYTLNVKAWACYGRSPIVGPMYIKDDNNLDLPDEWIDLVESDGFVPGEVREMMRQYLHTQGQGDLGVGKL